MLCDMPKNYFPSLDRALEHPYFESISIEFKDHSEDITDRVEAF